MCNVIYRVCPCFGDGAAPLPTKMNRIFNKGTPPPEPKNDDQKYFLNEMNVAQKIQLEKNCFSPHLRSLWLIS